MNLNSLPFVSFLVAVAVIHRLLRPRLRCGFLLLASWGFYLLCAPRFLPLLLFTTALTYGLGRWMASRPERKKALLILGLLLNFGVLFLFKYLGFFADLVSRALALAGLSPIALPSLLLPVGISFYTFAVCGYLMDVYRGQREPERNFLDFALFASFFPAVLSGPIERSGHLLPQLKALRSGERAPCGSDVKTAVTRFLLGLFKKMVIADQLAILVNTAYAAPESFTGVQLLAAALCYSLQIYCDFSAYSDMAVGSARLLGIELLENFDAPYLAQSVKEFWRRWHISLSSWFRDYLYFPLGGSRRGRARAYGNVLIVFAVSGLWHGAAMTFIVWGLLNGLYQVIGGLTAPARDRIRGALRLRPDGAITVAWQTAATFLLLTVTWVFFRASSFSQAFLVLRRIVTLAGGIFPLGFTALGLGRARLAAVALAVLVLLLWDVFGKRLRLVERLGETVWLRYAFWVVLILAVVVCGAYGTGYNAQEFLYFQF